MNEILISQIKPYEKNAKSHEGKQVKQIARFLRGKKFNRWTVIEEASKKGYIRYFFCQCDCGNQAEVRMTSLSSEVSKSCGCLQKEVTARLRNMLTHGMSKTRFYKIWTGIITRCYNKNRRYYKDYGGRGIKVVKRWHKFENFRNDMLEEYKHKSLRFGEKNISIERLDNLPKVK